MKRPRTVAEIAALPEGPLFGVREYLVTAEDRARGYAIIEGRRINIIGAIDKIMIPVAPEVVATYAVEDEPLGYRDADGIFWSLGQYANGDWFRQERPGL